MQIAICDDDPEALMRLSSILDDYRQERKASVCWRCFHSAAELLAAVRCGEYDLYLLDVMMPGESGMAAARAIRGFNQETELVFLSSSPDFAVESYQYRAQNYLLKPARREQLFLILDALQAKGQRLRDGLSVKTKTGVARILFERLAYVEVVSKRVYFHLSDGSVRELTAPLSAFEETLLARPEFVRTHRSYLVNLLQVAELNAAELTTLSGKTLPVSRQNYARVRDAYLAQLFAAGR